MSGLSEAQGLTASSDINNGTITACTISNSPISGSTGSFTSVTATGTIIPSFAIISAAGSAQGTAALCSAQNCSLMGVADGQTTGFSLMANKTGMTQCLFMNTAASGNLWPPAGGHINALANDAPFPLAANVMYTVFHYTASAYGVK